MFKRVIYSLITPVLVSLFAFSLTPAEMPTIQFLGQPEALPMLGAKAPEGNEVVPPASAVGAAKYAGSYGAGQLVSHGGAIQANPKYYLIFWGNYQATDTAGVASQMQDFTSRLYGAGDKWSNSLTQYCQGISSGLSACVDPPPPTTTTTKATTTTVKPTTTTVKPTTTTVKPTTTTVKPTTTTVKLTTTTVKPTTTTVKATTTTVSAKKSSVDEGKSISTVLAAASLPYARVVHPATSPLAGVWFDTSAVPANVDVNATANEALKGAQHFGNTTADKNANANYIVMLPKGSHACYSSSACFGTYYCAWHTYAQTSYGSMMFTQMPYIPDAGRGCGQSFVNSSNGTLDGVTIVGGHEIGETVSDPMPGSGWVDPYGYENGDKCSWISPNAVGGAKNVNLNGKTFPVQALWSNNFNNGGGGCPTSYTDPSNQSG